MHASSFAKMGELLDGLGLAPGSTVADVGAMAYHSQRTHRELCIERHLYYCGIDVAEGPNVDHVVPKHGPWYPSPCPSRFDLVISGQCLEHVGRPWEWIASLASIVKPDGHAIIIAPWTFAQHRYPIDCWRILPDGMAALFEWAGLEALTIGYDANGVDCWGVARKPNTA
jgi:SAM-dependent methyltransferase